MDGWKCGPLPDLILKDTVDKVHYRDVEQEAEEAVSEPLPAHHVVIFADVAAE